MAKQTHNDVFSKSLRNTDFYQEQKELAQKHKQELDEIRHAQERKKIVNDYSTFDGNICYEKAKSLSVGCIKVCKKLMEQKDYIILSPLCNQLTRCSTSVLANLSEGCSYHISYKDRIHKFNIASKECLETLSFLSLLFETGDISEADYIPLVEDCTQIIKILSKSIITMKKKL